MVAANQGPLADNEDRANQDICIDIADIVLQLCQAALFVALDQRIVGVALYIDIELSEDKPDILYKLAAVVV